MLNEKDVENEKKAFFDEMHASIDLLEKIIALDISVAKEDKDLYLKTVDAIAISLLRLDSMVVVRVHKVDPKDLQ